jgi:hypothetical protein
MERGGTKKFIQTGILRLLVLFSVVFCGCSQNNSHNEQNVPLKDTNAGIVNNIKTPISNEHDHGFDKSKIKAKTELDEMFPIKKRN